MTRKFISFPVADLQQTKVQMLNWGNRFNICCFLDNHQYNFSHNSVECLLAAGSQQSLIANAGNAFTQLQSFCDEADDWIFGHLCYDLKNEIEFLSSSNKDGVHLSDMFFFIPEVVVQLTASEMIIGAMTAVHEEIFHQILNASTIAAPPIQKHITIGHRYTKQEYISTVEQLKQHILRGDCYEINLCQEFYAEEVTIDPVELYKTLSASSPNPFSAYYKNEDKYLLCQSPERYLKKEGANIISQPIKGTSGRDAKQDNINIENLRASEKERAENIMIVDLVRNDLSKICREGTVKVDELCAVYSFPQVHQMISTVSGELKEGIAITAALKATFPMGSMTGAPKKKVMELIEKYERTRRGLFSGSLGYIKPGGDFDFNVVIRSLLYNASFKYLSFHTGSAITFGSDPETEYEECLLKAAAIKKALAETNALH